MRNTKENVHGIPKSNQRQNRRTTTTTTRSTTQILTTALPSKPKGKQHEKVLFNL